MRCSSTKNELGELSCIVRGREFERPSLWSYRKILMRSRRDRDYTSAGFKFLKPKANTMARVRHWFVLRLVCVVAVVSVSLSAAAQSCESSSDLDDAVRAAITSAAERDFDLAAKTDVSSLRQNAIANLASNFTAIENTVKDHQASLAGAQANVKSVFLLEADGTAPLARAEFYCGIFGKNGQTAGSAIFGLNNLPPGKYGVALLEATSAKGKSNFSLILQQEGTDWKLGGLYIKDAEISGHGADWFAAQARSYKTKGQMHNAWLYYLEARSLVSPLPFMDTLALDKLYSEFQNDKPADFPGDGKTADLNASTATYKLTALYPDAVGNDLDVIVKYQVTDASNANEAYASNVTVIKALAAKYPELRDAFTAVVARAVDSNNRDYGTLLAMKEIK